MKAEHFLLQTEKSEFHVLIEATDTFTKGTSELVSVIIPTRNYASYLEESIKSALNQTYKNIEIIVVDDGSTDNTKEIVSKYPVRYLYIEHRGNNTPARAHNLAFKLSHGKYITFIGADDKLLPTYIQRCVHEIEKNDRIGFVWTATEWFGEASGISHPRPWYHFGIYNGSGSGGAFGAMLMRREAFQTYDETLLASEDWEHALRMASHGWKYRGIDEPLYLYRVHPQDHRATRYKKTRIFEMRYPKLKGPRLIQDVPVVFRILVGRGKIRRSELVARMVRAR